MSSTQELLDQAIAAAEAGNRRNALGLLAQVVQLDPWNETAWLWLAELVETDAQRIDCLERVLSINRDNPLVHQRLRTLKPKPTPPPTPPSESQPSAESRILPSPPPVATAEPPAPSLQPPTPTGPAPTSPSLHSRAKHLARSLWTAIVCLTIVLLCLFLVWTDVSSPDTKDSARSTTFAAGDEAVLRSSSGVPVLVAVDKDALEAAVDAAATGDDYAKSELLLTGRLFSVDSGTRVLVTGLALFSTKVRILEGPYEGRTVWVIDEALSAH